VKEEYLGKHYSVLFLNHEHKLVKEIDQEMKEEMVSEEKKESVDRFPSIAAKKR
jgi:hypothetical protein